MMKKKTTVQHKPGQMCNKKACILFTVTLFLFTACTQKSNEARVEKWITDHAIPIKTVEAGNGFDDLVPIGDIVEDARIVSLGEPTHGNREVFQLKHRLTEYLVTEKGFNIFALECPFGEAFDVNQYILEGIGTPEQALAGIYFWTWDTEEFVELLRWMRAYNADPAHPDKVKFYGFDMQDPERAARAMLAYLRKVDPGLWQSARKELAILEIQFSDPIALGRRPYIPQECDEASLTEIKRVIHAFEQKKGAYIAAAGEEVWHMAKQYARQVERYLQACVNDGEKWNVIRDRTQADNIKWALDREGPSSRAIVWAHNCHVSNAAPKDDVPMHGTYLRKMYGDQLKIFGLFFNRGGFKAIDVRKPSKGVYAVSLDAAPPGTLEYTLSAAGDALMAVDLHGLPGEGPVRDWFHTMRPTRHSGAGYHEERPEDYFWSYIPAEAYDVLVYLDTTTPVRYHNDAVFDYIWMLDKKLDAPVNLDFENGAAGEAPEGWTVWSKFQRLGVELLISGKDPYQGKHAAMIHRPAGVSFGEITPNLTQRIDASRYKGKTIRVKVACRSGVQAPGFAFFRLTIDPDFLQSAHDGRPPLFDSLDELRIDANKWKVYEIETEVPEEAGSITYGMYLRDHGTAWMDAVEIEVVQ